MSLTQGTAVVIVHMSADGQVAGPQLAVRGPTFSLGLAPKRIWGEGSKGHSIEYTVNMNTVHFPAAGHHRLISKWTDMTSSTDFTLKDKDGAVKKDLSKVKGAVRLNLFNVCLSYLL